MAAEGAVTLLSQHASVDRPPARQADDLAAKNAAGGVQAGSDRSASVAGDTRAASPGDASNVPHPGEDLPAMKDDAKPRAARGEEPSSAGPADISSTVITGEREAAGHGGGGADGQPEPEGPRRVNVDGHEIEVTGDPADGLWVQGLPGEVPDKAGDVFLSPEDAERSPGDEFLRDIVEDAHDVFDTIDQNVSLGWRIDQRPPVHPEVSVPAHGPAVESPHHGSPNWGPWQQGCWRWESCYGEPAARSTGE